VSVSIRFAPFDQADFQAWLVEAIPSFALANVDEGTWTLAESIVLSQGAHDALLPQGLATPGQFFVHVHDVATDERVGMLWWAEAAKGGAMQAWVYNLTINAAARGRGYARAALREFEGVAREHGMQQLGLHVFGHNHVARRLYESLGFEPSSLTLRKILT